MIKESVNKFDLEAAFKALNEVEIPVVKGIRPNRENLQEKFTKKLVTEVLVEDYYDVNDSADLEQAQDEREAEIAKAKLARIEKIVDLDAETEEDLLPSYVGKFIIQCPQCMTLFYKKEEDIEKSEENPDVVNLNEPCQHCGNSSGYTLVGKVDQVGEDEAENYDAEDFEENELNLDFDETEEPVEDTEEPAEETSEESTEEEAATEGEEDLAPIEETEEEEVKESLNESAVKQRVFVDYTGSNAAFEKAYKTQLEKDGEESFEAVEDAEMKAVVAAVEAGDNVVLYTTDDDYKVNCPEIADKANFKVVTVSRELTEDVDLNKQLDLYNDFIKYLQKMVEQDEDALEEAKKLGNKEVIAAIEKRLENSKAELKAALPTTVKDEVSADELPTPEEADMEDAAENKEETKKETKESLTEDFDAEAKLDAEEAALKKTNVEEVVIEAANSDVVRALDNLEAELTEEVKITEANYDVSDADFRAMLKNPVFNEACKDCKEDLTEDLPPVDDAAFERAAAAIEAAGSELTPEEQRLEDEELAAKEGVEESLTEAASLNLDPAIAARFTKAQLDNLTPEEIKILQNPRDREGRDKIIAKYNPKNKLGEAVVLRNTDQVCSVVLGDKQVFTGTKEECEKFIKNHESEAAARSKGGFKLLNTAEVYVNEYNPLDEADHVSTLKRKYSTTELMVKELVQHPLFKGLSTRTVQRVLLPYYIEYMGRENLSTQALIDFFEEEGFAPYVLDHFMEMDPLARKELLKADAKFMEIFNAYALEYDLFPGSKDDLEPGENDFDYVFNIVFESDTTEGIHDTIKAFAKMYANGKFDKAIVEPPVTTWESVEDLDDESFNKLTENYLTEVYSNVKSFKATNCDLTDNKLVIEGIITFNSGKSKTTTFVYEAVKVADGKIILEGLNSDFASEKAFKLNCKLNTAKCLIIESLNYNYTINENLVKGSLIK